MRTILRRLRRIARLPSRAALPEAIHLPALGERWAVRYRPTAGSRVQARCGGNGTLTVSGCVQDRGRVAEALRRWLSRHARRSLVPWLEELGLEAGLSYAGVSVRGQRTRWASCSARAHISLNYRLLFLPPDMVRYILNHELFHTVHMDHSRSFWAALSRVEPRCRELSRQARRGMERVPDWAKG